MWPQEGAAPVLCLSCVRGAAQIWAVASLSPSEGQEHSVTAQRAVKWPGLLGIVAGKEDMRPNSSSRLCRLRSFLGSTGRASHRNIKAHVMQLYYQGWALNKNRIRRFLCGVLTTPNFKTFENHLLCKNFLVLVGNIWGNTKHVKALWFFTDRKLGCNWVKIVRSFCV